MEEIELPSDIKEAYLWVVVYYKDLLDRLAES